VRAISREEIVECIAAACSRKHRLGEHLKSVLGTLWSFLGDDARRRETSVPANLLLRLKTPERPVAVRRDAETVEIIGLFKRDNEDLRRDVPSAIEMGRVIAIAGSGGMKEGAALSVLSLEGIASAEACGEPLHRSRRRLLVAQQR
jgi:hypothetical protein